MRTGSLGGLRNQFKVKAVKCRQMWEAQCMAGLAFFDPEAMSVARQVALCNEALSVTWSSLLASFMTGDTLALSTSVDGGLN